MDATDKLLINSWGAYNGLTTFMSGTIYLKEVQFWIGLGYTLS